MSNSNASIPRYPLAETDASFGAASRLVRQTGSYPRDRALAVLSLTGMFAGSLTLGIGLTAVLAMYVSKAAAGIVFLALVLGLALVLLPMVERRFFAMRCSFAFLVTELLMRRSAIPQDGTAEAAQKFLAERFGDLSGPIFDAHMDVRRMVGSFFRTFDKLDELLPIDLGPVRRALGWIVDRIAPNIADLALSFAVARGDSDYAESAKDAVAYVAQNPKALIGTAARAWFLERTLGGLIGFITLVVFGGATFAATMAMASGAAADSGIAAEGAQTIGIFAAIFAALLVGAPFASLTSWFIRTAFLEPVALTMLLVRFHTVIQGQAVDPGVRARLSTANASMGSARGLANLFE